VADSKLHADEFDIDAGLVARLVGTQFPQWAGLPLTPVRPAGTDNVLYRLGADLVVRLPRQAGGADQIDKVHRWLPLLARHLPLAVPEPVGRGVPGEGYPGPWSVYRWLDGAAVADQPLTDQRQAAADLADFVTALQAVDATGGPPAYRGGELRPRDEHVRESLRELVGMLEASWAESLRELDVDAAAACWEESLAQPAWTGPPVWVHSDLMPGNLLARDGRLSAVIDFGCMGVGDPACDLMPAWMVLSAEGRKVFRERLEVDDATWVRGRGWALCAGVGGVPYYAETDPAFAEICRRAIAACLADLP
jgi:aminoglycoside phosphotransferase (APT) family kinase protein